MSNIAIEDTNDAFIYKPPSCDGYILLYNDYEDDDDDDNDNDDDDDEDNDNDDDDDNYYVYFHLA